MPLAENVADAVPVVIALGSNLGDRAALLESAVTAVGNLDGVRLDGVSAFGESAALTPAGTDPARPPYLNAVLLASTTLAPAVLLGRLHAIEAAHGRKRSARWADRTLDLDLIDYGGRHVEEPGLSLPHPRAAERRFVLAPWLEVDPDAVLPGYGPVAAVLQHVPDAGTVGRSR